MPTTRLKTTTEAVHAGIETMPVDKAISNIEGWEEYLGKHDHEGVKKVLTDLGKLKKLLQKDEVDSEAVHKLLVTIGKDTVKVAGDEENANAKHIRELGEALAQKPEGGAKEKKDSKESKDAEEEKEPKAKKSASKDKDDEK